MNEWLSIKDRLPECEKNSPKIVLIALYSDIRKMYHISVAEYQRNKFYDYKYNEYIPIDDPYWSIKYWMELPNEPE